jgi:3-oxoacyl-[acyl-carrier protein] reductase
VITRPGDPRSTDRVAIVTGGSRGIGREVALTLASRGYGIVLTYEQDQGQAEAAVEEVLAANGTALSVRADVADELDVGRLFAETIEAFGHVDVVVHADAGARTFVVDQEASRHLRDGGAIVDLRGPTGPAPPSSDADPAREGPLDARSRVLVRQLRGRDITVNAVVPARERSGTLAAVADVVAFLVSADGRRVDEQVIRVDGRRSVRDVEEPHADQGIS